MNYIKGHPASCPTLDQPFWIQTPASLPEKEALHTAMGETEAGMAPGLPRREFHGPETLEVRLRTLRDAPWSSMLRLTPCSFQPRFNRGVGPIQKWPDTKPRDTPYDQSPGPAAPNRRAWSRRPLETDPCFFARRCVTAVS